MSAPIQTLNTQSTAYQVFAIEFNNSFHEGAQWHVDNAPGRGYFYDPADCGFTNRFPAPERILSEKLSPLLLTSQHDYYVQMQNQWKHQDSIVIVPHQISRNKPAGFRSVPTREEFDRLVKQWKLETRAQSSLSKIYTHPAYQRIIGMGTPAVPWVLEDLENFPTRWFYALKCMVGSDVADSDTTFEEAREQWLAWGRQHGLL